MLFPNTLSLIIANNSYFCSMENTIHNRPLADRMRPLKLSDYKGQSHILQGALGKSLDKAMLPSLILWGPPGTGKTTLAYLLASHLNRTMYVLNAISSGVKDVRETIEKAEKQRFFNAAAPILFIDEIHRFNKGQQDSLLHAVEKGIVTLIGATTENPSFEVIAPLLSRCQVYVLNHLSEPEMKEILHRALEQDSVLKEFTVNIAEYEALFQLSGGDARKLLNTLELIVLSASINGHIEITNQNVLEIVQKNIALYDKGGEQHYDVISAFIKSVRGSDPNASIYWLARMLDGGEDIKFIARRLIILAAEDIGLANPNALLIAQSCFNAIQVIGMPEARIILSEATIYLATSQKGNSAYLAIDKALEYCRNNKAHPIPLHLRNAPTQLMKNLNYGAQYKYPHDHQGNFVYQYYLPDDLKDMKFYLPQDNPKEREIDIRMKSFWKK